MDLPTQKKFEKIEEEISEIKVAVALVQSTQTGFSANEAKVDKKLEEMNAKLDTLLTSKSLVVGFLACLVLFFQTIWEGAREGIKHLAEFLK